MNKNQLQTLIPIVIIAVGSLVLLGWASGIENILSIIPSAPTMKFNTALLFILIALSILLLGNTNKLLNGLAVAFAILTFTISFITLLQYFIDLDFGIDNFFITDSLSENEPGRMSRATAFCFMMISLAKVLRGLSKNKDLKSTNYLITLVAIISLLAFSNYLLMLFANNFALIFNTMAIHTAFLFFLASLTISLKHPDHSYLGFLTGRYVGSKQARSLLPFVVGLPVILSTVLLLFINSGFFDTSYGVALYTIAYASISIFYFSIIFTRLNKSDKKRVKLEATLKASNQELSQYKLALDKSSIVSITNDRGIITYVNEKFVEISGYGREEAIGQTHKLVNSGHHPDTFFQDLWHTILNGSVWIGGIKNKTKSGDFYWVHVVIVPLLNPAGKGNQYLSIEQDITQKTVLSHQYENLQLKNKEIEQFTYIASHDLQEPLRTLKSMSNLLQKKYGEKLDDDANKMLDFISNAGLRMSEMVKGLLDYSIIGVHKELEEVNTTAIIESVKKDLSELIESNKAVVTFSDLPTMKAYGTELRLLFQNLIQNAIKFRSLDKNPEINISVIREQNQYKFCVRDNGIGISSDQLTNIFGLFKRLNSRKMYEGTGIGLAHCEKIVHLHGGNIWAESEVGQGSSFYFTIPTI